VGAHARVGGLPGRVATRVLAIFPPAQAPARYRKNLIDGVHANLQTPAYAPDWVYQ